MIRADLMPDLMNDIIDVEIVAHRDGVCGRSNSPPFCPVDANATDATSVPAATGSTEHVAEVIIRFANVSR